MQDYTFNTPEPIELFIELGSGSASVEAADIGTTQVAVHGDDNNEVEVKHEGRQVSIRQRSGRRWSFTPKDVEVRVIVPLGSQVVTRSGSADLSATGAFASGDFKSGSGSVHVDSFTGEVSAKTGSGGVRIVAVGGPLLAKTGSGSVHVERCEGPAKVSTGSGDVRLGTLLGDAVVKTGSGSLEVQQAGADLSFTAGSGGLQIRDLRSGSIKARLASGDVELGIPSGTPVWTDISSVSGKVHNDLPSTGAPQEGQPHIELRVATTSGDVRLRAL